MFTHLVNLGKTIGSCAQVWYLEGSNPRILIDAGSTASWFLSRGQPMEDIQTIENGLGGKGLSPEDIDIVILTHLHGDHVQLAHKFTRAKFIVQKEELAFALNPHPMAQKFKTFEKQYFADLDFEVIDGDRNIIPGVDVMLTPGHTPGGQSVIVDTPEGKAVIPGFCCTFENFNPPASIKNKGLLVIPPSRHYDLLQAYDSILKVKELGYHIIPSHETSFLGRDRLP